MWKAPGIIEESGGIAPPEDYSKSPVAGPKGMEIQELPNKVV